MTGDLIQIVEYVSECDVTPVLEPMSRDDAMAVLRKAAARGQRELDRFDLTDAATGRFVSWVIS